jgi:hypothetical protein
MSESRGKAHSWPPKAGALPCGLRAGWVQDGRAAS